MKKTVKISRLLLFLVFTALLLIGITLSLFLGKASPGENDAPTGMEPYISVEIPAGEGETELYCTAADDISIVILSEIIEALSSDQPYLSRVAIGKALINRYETGTLGDSFVEALGLLGLYPQKEKEKVSRRSYHAAIDAYLSSDITFGAIYFMRNDDKRIDEYKDRLTLIVGDFSFILPE